VPGNQMAEDSEDTAKRLDGPPSPSSEQIDLEDLEDLCAEAYFAKHVRKAHWP